jgi:Tfp pilus assembly protein FimT
MALPKACVPKTFLFDNTGARFSSRGFTILEVLIVASLAIIIMALGLAMSMDAFRGFSFRNDRDAAVAALQRARTQAVNNVCLGLVCDDGKKHGIEFDAGKKEFTVFQGDDYASRDTAVDETIKFESSATYVDPSSTIFDIVFDQLSGNATAGKLILKDTAGREAAIEINSVGQIDF